MNVKRGLTRLWIVFSAAWCLGLLTLSLPDWYHAASDWYRSQGLEITGCKPWELYSHFPVSKPPPGFSSGEWLIDCFHVRGLGGRNYLVEVHREGWDIDEVRNLVLNNPDLFPTRPGESKPGVWQPPASDEVLVDVTQRAYPIPNYDLKTARFLTILAVGVPLGFLVLARCLWWVGMGFRSESSE
jgi:hypothetical protein